jgi:hypothetical protein
MPHVAGHGRSSSNKKTKSKKSSSPTGTNRPGAKDTSKSAQTFKKKYSTPTTSSQDNRNRDNLQSQINQSMGVDRGLAQAVQNYVPPKQTINPNLGNTYQDYVNQGITDPRQLAAQSMKDAGISNLAGSGSNVYNNALANYYANQGGSTLTGDIGTTDTGTGDTDDTLPEDKKDEKEKEQIKYDTGDGTIGYRDLKLLEKKLGQEAIIRNGKIFFVDKVGSIVPAFRMVDKLSDVLDKFTGFNPEKTFGDMGDTGKAALFNKIGKMSSSEFENFLNRKGNLDRLLEYKNTLPPSERNILESSILSNDPTGFANLIKGSGGEGFQNELDKIQNPREYYSRPENRPRTSGDLENLANLGITYLDGYGPIERPNRGGNQQGGGGGGSQPTTPDPTPDPTPTNVPDFLLKRQYMPNFTPSYLGGPEQMQVAGGYYDPVTKKFIGNPYGTANQYQFAKGGIVGTSPLLFKNQGGMASDKGIKSFKKYGY